LDIAMPIRKSRLSRSELATYRVAAQELLRAGRIHKIPDEWLEDADFLHIFVAGAPISQVFDLPKARTGFAIWVRLVAERSPITILECDLTAPWDGGIVLEDHRGCPPVYRIGHRQYQQAEVLNHRLEGSLRFHRRGDMVEGLILATGLEPIPQEYVNGSLISLRLTFTDQFDVTITKDTEVVVERELRSRREKQVKQSGTGLYGPAEIPIQQEELVDGNQSTGEQLPGFLGGLETV
jgi:hypothetical protein